MYNTLKVVDYLPAYRREILLIYVDRLLNLDVHAPREDILAPTNEDQFVMEDMGMSNVAEALDCGMLLMFRYIDNTCKLSNGELRWVETKALFADLLEVNIR